MDHYDKFMQLLKFANNNVANNELKKLKSNKSTMEILHGEILRAIYNTQLSDDNDKLARLSSLSIASAKMTTKLIILEKELNKIIDHSSTDSPSPIVEKHKQNNLSEKLNKNVPSLILFYADWCKPCKAFLPTWNNMMSIKRNNINVVKISCVEYDDECAKIPIIVSYPTIVLYMPKSDTLVKFNEMRNFENIMQFVKFNTGISL